MLKEIEILKKIINEKIKIITNNDELENFRLQFLVKKGAVQQLFDKLKTIATDEKPSIGKELNLLSKFTENEYKKLKEKFENIANEPAKDVTLAGRTKFIGSKHPVLQIIDEMVDIFRTMGFNVAEGPQIEDEFHNFDALNFQPEHPARDMQDTFFIKNTNNRKNILLRTHTSPVQIRVMLEQDVPIRAVMPGRVYRNEAISSRSLAEFHQIEGIYVNKSVSFAELKATMISFAKKMYGENSEFRFRPSYFPFTEPSAEVDISCYLCKGKGCRICKHTGWLEIAGCGMIHPNVLRSGGINPEEFTGYAFGFGIERVALLRTGIDDIRYFYENDVRILRQF